MNQNRRVRKKNLGADWQSNWGSSIAVKATAPVLWMLIFLGLIIATIVHNQYVSSLPKIISDDADRLAYMTTRYLVEREGGQPLDLKGMLSKELEGMKFTHGEVQVKNRTISFNLAGDHTTSTVSLTRDIYYSDTLTDPELLLARMTLYHPPLQQLIQSHRKHFLVVVGIPLLIFGLTLAWFTHMIVTRPIFELVKATKAISDGDINLRLQSGRKDEFGHLAQFFNQMLDNLQAKQDLLSKAVIEAESANKMKSNFLANMSHEIRTPLTAIIGYADLMKKGQQTEQEQISQIEAIGRSSRHLLEIINDILDLSKIEAGQLVIETLPVSPIKVVKEVENIIAVRAEEKGLSFNVNYRFPLPRFIITDPTRLRQILLNLCSNAVKFSNEGSININIGYNDEVQRIKFEVTDAGIGMTDDEIERLFKPFSQADTSTTREYGGTGLGLSISKQLAEQLGGEISCISRKKIGSKFTLTVDTGKIDTDDLIYTLDDAESIQNTVSSTITKPMLMGRVLLAEDTPDNQMLISMYIRRTGAEVDVVENGKQAVESALQNEYDLVFMDMHMPVVDGLQAVQILRLSGYSKPIVALTANALKEDRDKCISAGTDDYLTKPIELDKFNKVLCQYLKPDDANNGEQENSDIQSQVAEDAFNLEDPEYRALMEKFVSGLSDDIQSIKTAYAKSRWTDLIETVHKLKGLGASFGFNEITDVATQLQIDLVTKRIGTIEQQTEMLINLCQDAITSRKQRISHSA